MVDKFPKLLLGGQMVCLSRLLGVKTLSKSPKRPSIDSVFYGAPGPTFEYLDSFDYLQEKCVSCQCVDRKCDVESDTIAKVMNDDFHDKAIRGFRTISVTNREKFFGK